MKLAACLTTIIAFLAFAATASSSTEDPRLNAVASRFAQRPVHALCYEEQEKGAPQYYGAWGYVLVPTAKQTAEHLDGSLCAGALDINNPLLPRFQRAQGALVLVHEAFHLKLWGAAGSEGKVECQAIRHWKLTARMLGATEATVADLWPTALASHYEETNLFDIWNNVFPYRDDTCIVPPLVEEDVG